MYDVPMSILLWRIRVWGKGGDFRFGGVHFHHLAHQQSDQRFIGKMEEGLAL